MILAIPFFAFLPHHQNKDNDITYVQQVFDPVTKALGTPVQKGKYTRSMSDCSALFSSSSIAKIPWLWKGHVSHMLMLLTLPCCCFKAQETIHFLYCLLQNRNKFFKVGPDSSSPRSEDSKHF